MEIQKDSRNELLKRQEISVVVDSDKNPGFLEMKKQLALELKKKEEVIDVYNVKGKFGRGTFLIKAYVYDNPETLAEMKNLSKTKKQKTEEKKAVDDAAKAAAEAKKAEEAPKEA